MTTAIAIEDVRREVKILRALTGHENLVHYYDACEDNLNVYIVMEYVSLHTLSFVSLEHPHWCSVCDPAKIFLTSKFSYFFATPPIKQKTGTANRWETTNSKPHGPIIMVGQSKTGSSSQIIFITLCFGRCTTSFYQPQQTVQKSWAKNILLSQTGMFFFTQF